MISRWNNQETSSKRAKDQKQSPVEFQKDIIAILTHLINFPPDNIEVEIEHGLKSIGEFCRADRSYLILISDEGKVIKGSYEWCAEGIEPQIKNVNGLLLEIFAGEWEIFTRLEPINIPRVADLPPGAFIEKRLLQALDIQSLLLIPLVLGGTCEGLLGLDSIRSEKNWGEEELELLKGAGEAIVTILAHRRADATLKDSLQRIERIKKEWESTADSLSELVFLIDNKYFIIRSNRAVESWGLGSVLSVRGRNIHQLLHPGCVNPDCIFGANLPKVWEKLSQNHSVKWEFPDRILKRYLSVQIRPISAINEGKKQLSFAVVAINNITKYKIKEKEREKLVRELQNSLSKSNRLRGTLPICSSCKKIRDDTGHWNQIEVYIQDRSEVEFTPGICPECIEKLYPDLK